MSSISEKWAQKSPKTHEKASNYFNTLKEVWVETFPHFEKEAKNKMDLRKIQAKTAREIREKQEEMTPEELELYLETIPEWKRGALVVTD